MEEKRERRREGGRGDRKEREEGARSNRRFWIEEKTFEREREGKRGEEIS